MIALITNNKNNMRKGAPLRVGNTLQKRLASKVL